MLDWQLAYPWKANAWNLVYRIVAGLKLIKRENAINLFLMFGINAPDDVWHWRKTCWLPSITRSMANRELHNDDVGWRWNQWKTNHFLGKRDTFLLLFFLPNNEMENRMLYARSTQRKCRIGLSLCARMRYNKNV